jgi:predicted PurR-regulated permease PerM
MLKSYETWLKIAVCLLGLYFLGKVTPIYFPVLLSMILAFILHPLVNYMIKIKLFGKTALNRSVAVLLTFLCAILLVTVIGAFVLLPFIQEFNKFIVDFPKLIVKVQEIAFRVEERASMLELPANINLMIDRAISSAASFSADLAHDMINGLVGFATSAVQLVVVPVLTFYFLRDWDFLRDKTISLFAVEARPRVRQIIDEFSRVISGYIRGQVLISIVIGLMVFCGMYALGVAYPLVLGLLATCTETIPIIGPIIGSVPAILVAYLSSPALALKVVLFYIIVHQMENHIVVPNIMGHTIDLHPVIIIISLLIGGQLLGIMGMMLAVPVAALLRVLVNQLWNAGG